jgi:hypothetical protein
MFWQSDQFCTAGHPTGLLASPHKRGPCLDGHTASPSFATGLGVLRLHAWWRNGPPPGVYVMENFFITLAVIAFSGLVVFCFVIEPRMKH